MKYLIVDCALETEEEISELAKSFNLTFELINLANSYSGWPDVKFIGEEDDLIRFIVDYADSDYMELIKELKDY